MTVKMDTVELFVPSQLYIGGYVHIHMGRFKISTTVCT